MSGVMISHDQYIKSCDLHMTTPPALAVRGGAGCDQESDRGVWADGRGGGVASEQASGKSLLKRELG